MAPVFTTMTTSEPREGYARQAGFTRLDPEGWKDELACKSGDDDSACEGGWTGDNWDSTCAFDGPQDFSLQNLGSRAKYNPRYTPNASKQPPARAARRCVRRERVSIMMENGSGQLAKASLKEKKRKKRKENEGGKENALKKERVV